jgi:hypothetical protein
VHPAFCIGNLAPSLAASLFHATSTCCPALCACETWSWFDGGALTSRTHVGMLPPPLEVLLVLPPVAPIPDSALSNLKEPFWRTLGPLMLAVAGTMPTTLLLPVAPAACVRKDAPEGSWGSSTGKKGEAMVGAMPKVVSIADTCDVGLIQ